MLRNKGYSFYERFILGLILVKNVDFWEKNRINRFSRFSMRDTSWKIGQNYRFFYDRKNAQE